MNAHDHPTLKLLSWNIQWGRGLDGRVDLVRIAAVAHESEADVLCLQEVAVNHPGLPGGAPMNQAEWLGGLFLGYESVYAVGSDLPDGLGGRRQFGNLILSRRPVLQVFRHLLPWPADPSVPSMQRVALEAVIEAPDLPGGALRVITTHLEYYSAVQRAAQIRALREICDNGWRHAVAPRSHDECDPPFAVLPRGEGCVLCGDFNSPVGSVEHAPLLEEDEAPALVNAWDCAHPAVLPAPTFVSASRSQSEHEPSRKPDLLLSGSSIVHPPTFGIHDRRFISAPACYDAFYVSSNIADRVVDVSVDAGTDASDHQPVLLTLQG